MDGASVSRSSREPSPVRLERVERTSERLTDENEVGGPIEETPRQLGNGMVRSLACARPNCVPRRQPQVGARKYQHLLHHVAPCAQVGNPDISRRSQERNPHQRPFSGAILNAL